jgi:hypothetical protein
MSLFKESRSSLPSSQKLAVGTYAKQIDIFTI